MSPMHQTKTGRWNPDKPKRDPLPVPLYEQYGINLSVPMPWWYPLMSFQAAVGRLVLEDEQP